jgi:hypothetical protein
MGTWAACTHKQQLVQAATSTRQQLAIWHSAFQQHAVPAMACAQQWVVMKVVTGWPALRQLVAEAFWWCWDLLCSSRPHLQAWGRAFSARLEAAMHLAALVGGVCFKALYPAASLEPFREVVVIMVAGTVAAWVLLQVSGRRWSVAQRCQPVAIVPLQFGLPMLCCTCKMAKMVSQLPGGCWRLLDVPLQALPLIATASSCCILKHIAVTFACLVLRLIRMCLLLCLLAYAAV